MITFDYTKGGNMIGKVIGQGRTATVYEYNKNVIKLFNKNFSSSFIEKEFEINQMANSIHCKIPIALDMINIEDKVGIVYEKVIGETVSQRLLEDARQVAIIGGRWLKPCRCSQNK
jgi:hypothetical protein